LTKVTSQKSNLPNFRGGQRVDRIKNWKVQDEVHRLFREKSEVDWKAYNNAQSSMLVGLFKVTTRV
jgi:hypothetical protein